MSLNPDISVIMSVYNGEKYLKESLDSISTQTYPHYEFIIINDGSTDASQDILSAYAANDHRVKLVTRNNRGLIASLNEALALAQGRYIARFDCDDISMPDRLEKQISYFTQNPGTDILGTCISTFGELEGSRGEEVENWFNAPISDAAMERIVLQACPLAHPTVMVKKEVYRQLGGYSEQYPCAEDYDLWSRAVKQGFTLRKLKSKLVRYRVHRLSKSYLENISLHNIYNDADIKLDYLGDGFGRAMRNCVIWGAGNGGRVAFEILRRRLPHVRIEGFIDQYKTGSMLGFPILKPEDIQKLTCDYVFIATAPGRPEAEQKLETLGLAFKKDFLYLV